MAFGGRDNEDLMQERVFRGLVRQASTDLRFFRRSRRLCGPLISGVRRMITAKFPRSDMYMADTCDLMFSVCTRPPSATFGGADLRLSVSRAEWRRPLLKRLRLHVPRSSIDRSASFTCSSWLICGLLRSPAPCTPPQPCSPYSEARRQVVGQDAYALNGGR